MSDNKSSYGNIFKSTFLFGFVQIARLLVGVVKNKVVAILLGPSGLGIISIYNNVISMIKTGASLGVNQSAVKDVSEAHNSNNEYKLSRVISVTNKVVIATSLLGTIITIILSPFLSQWGFSDNLHVWAFIFLSIAVGFDIFVDNQLAILKGMRRLRDLAKASLYGAFIALVVGVPFFFIFGINGIVPSIVVSAIVTAIVSSLYVHRINYIKVKLTIRDVWYEGSPMIRMGIALMLSNFMSYFFNMVILGYIQNTGGLDDVGYYNAGSVLVISYFSMVTTALNTDYYPRIAAMSEDNKSLKEEVYKQSKVGLLLMFPLVVIFTLFAPIFIHILYSDKFDCVIMYTDIAIIGTLISVVSNCLGYIFIVKQESILYLTTSIVLYIVFIPIYIFLYKFLNLYGLGISFSLNVLSQLVVYAYFAWKKYRISLSSALIIRLLFISAIIATTIYVRALNGWMLYLSILFLLVLVSVLSIKELESTLNEKICTLVKNRLNRK